MRWLQNAAAAVVVVVVAYVDDSKANSWSARRGQRHLGTSSHISAPTVIQPRQTTFHKV